MEKDEEFNFTFNCSSTVIIERLNSGEAWYANNESIHEIVQVGICGSQSDAKEIVKESKKKKIQGLLYPQMGFERDCGGAQVGVFRQLGDGYGYSPLF